MRAGLEASGQRDKISETIPTRMMKGYDRVPELWGKAAATVQPCSITAFEFYRLYFCSQALKAEAEQAGFRVAHADVIYYHGSCFVVDGMESHDDICAEIYSRTGYEVVSVDYRLAPEHPFPGPVDDAPVFASRYVAVWE